MDLNYPFCAEYPHTFTSSLKGQDVVENDRCEFEIDVEADDAEVIWYHNGEIIDVKSGRFEIIKKGKKRKLVLKCASLIDSGEICVKTNTQSSSCQLNVKCENSIVSGLPAKATVLEREELSFPIKIRDPTAPVNLFLNGQQISDNFSRLTLEDLGQGNHLILFTCINLIIPLLPFCQAYVKCV